MPVNGMDDARLVIWPDVDLAGDKHSSKATGGYWVERQCREHGIVGHWRGPARGRHQLRSRRPRARPSRCSDAFTRKVYHFRKHYPAC
eukprot:1054060-Heterocapsa_arctica.AAC.1